MERELAFLKRHGFLIAGVGLPLLLVAAMIVARAVPRVLVDDPRYDVVYAIDGPYDGGDDRRVEDVTVDHGRLVVRWNLVEEPGYRPRRRVFRADALRGRMVELSVPEPEVDELEAHGGRVEYEIEGLEGVRLDGQPLSPDGYSFSASYSGGGGVFGELFFHSSRGMRTRIQKDGRVLDVPSLTTGGYGNVYFLGWAVPEEEGR